MIDEAILRQLVEEFIPFNKFLGMRARELKDGFAVLELPFRDDFIGDPIRRAMHGGVLSAMADTAGGIAVWTQLADESRRVSTIDLRIDYLRPGKSEAVLCEAKVVRQGNRVGVCDMRLFHPSAEAETIATGKGVYNIVQPK